VSTPSTFYFWAHAKRLEDHHRTEGDGACPITIHLIKRARATSSTQRVPEDCPQQPHAPPLTTPKDRRAPILPLRRAARATFSNILPGKTGQFCGATERGALLFDQWLMWQMGGRPRWRDSAPLSKIRARG